MSSIAVNDYAFEYVEQGTGVPVVLVHGSVNDYRIWKHQIDPFARHFRTIAYSRRYHFPNAWKGDGSDYSLDLHVRDLAAFIAALNLGKVHLVGSSYGAYTALMLAIRNPELVGSLVLGEPPILPLLVLNPENPLHILSLFIRDFATAKRFMNFGFRSMKPAQKALRDNRLEEGAQLFARGALGDESYNQMSQEFNAMLIDNARTLQAELLGPLFPPFPISEARKLTNPTLFVYGEHSPKFLHAISDILVKNIPGSEKVVIPNASHLIHVENPVDYNNCVLNFLLKQ
jgi:pimeloyl-ACP methyl ester carboxylesterase